MTITTYSGLPGSGKSYGVVENVILPALKSGRRVWTNIPMNEEELIKSGIGTPTSFTNEDLENDPDFFQNTFEAGAIMVIDECWRFWPAGLKAVNMHQGHKSFFAEHRHMVGVDGKSTDIVLVTQDLSQIAANVRALVNSTYRSVSLVSIGSKSKFRIDIYEGAVTGNKPSKSSRVRQIYSKYDPKVYKYYKSQTMNQGGDHAEEQTTDDRINILKSPLLRYGAPTVILLVGLFIYYGYSTVTDKYGSGEIEKHGVIEKQSTKKPVVKAYKAPSKGFLDNREIYISYNEGHFPILNYRFLVTDSNDLETSLDTGDLYRLGYSIKPINPCLVKVVSMDSVYFAQCKVDVYEDGANIETNLFEYSSGENTI